MPMRSCTLMILLLLALPSGAIERKKDGAYLCVPEMAVGFAFDEQQHHWRSTVFKPGPSFVLRLRYLGERSQPGSWGAGRWDAFDARIVAKGADGGAPCFSLNGPKITSSTPPDENAYIDKYDSLRCTVLDEQFIFNARSSRFERRFPGGFLVGDEKKDTPPLMEGGTCTRIQ